VQFVALFTCSLWRYARKNHVQFVAQAFSQLETYTSTGSKQRAAVENSSFPVTAQPQLPPTEAAPLGTTMPPKTHPEKAECHPVSTGQLTA
jgi:hypothetical protein